MGIGDDINSATFLVHACRKIVKRMMDSDRQSTGKHQASDSQKIGDGRVLEGGMDGPMTAFARLLCINHGDAGEASGPLRGSCGGSSTLPTSTCRWICDLPWGRIVRLAVCVAAAARSVLRMELGTLFLLPVHWSPNGLLQGLDAVPRASNRAHPVLIMSRSLSSVTFSLTPHIFTPHSTLFLFFADLQVLPTSPSSVFEGVPLLIKASRHAHVVIGCP